MSFLFGRKKSSESPKQQQFEKYHREWVERLSSNLVPVLRKSMSANSPPTLLPNAVESVFTHLTSYYYSLDSTPSPPHLLFPTFRSRLEVPFLWLGHLHPYLFTNLLRSFIDDNDDDEEDDEKQSKSDWERSDIFEKNWNVIMAWKNPSKGLMGRIDQIECGLRLMVPALASRAREAQARFVERVGKEWGKKDRVREAIGEAMEVEMEEMTGVFIDANRLRRSVLADIMSSVNVYQGALFLEALAQFLVGFKDSELIAEFEKCKVAIN